MKLFSFGVIFGPLPAKIGGWDELGKTDRCEVGSTEGGGRRALLRGGGGGDFVRSLNGQSVPTETGSNVRSAMKWPPSRLLSLSSECVSVSVCVGLFSPKTSPKISEHILSLWECFPFFSLFKIAPVVQLEAAFQSWWDHES